MEREIFMNLLKKESLKFVVIGVAVFVIGIFAKESLDYGMFSSIQGYLFNSIESASSSNASSSNASSANASSSNASSSNASSSNASSSNASSANAISTDNIIYLQNFALSNVSAKQGDRVNVTIATSGACNSGASIVFASANGTSFTAQVQNITGNPYIIIPKSAIATTYEVTDVLLVGRNSNNTTFTKQYSRVGANIYNFNSSLAVLAKSGEGNLEDSKVTLINLSLDSTSAKVNEKVYLNIQASQKLNSLKLVFTSIDGKMFTVYAKDLTEAKSYIEIPTSTEAGTYSLTSAILATSKSSTAYSNDGEGGTEKFDFNSTLEISDGNEKTFIYNNEDVTSDVLAKLYNAPSGSEITINADYNTLINEELFNVIKGKNKKLIINYKDNQIVFNGRDITVSKTIDITMTVGNVSSNKNISKLVSNGVIVNFPDNGNLPGRALVRLKTMDKIDKILSKKVYVYIYNVSSNNFCAVNTNVKKSSDGYYEFTITHNSDYLITNDKLDKKLVVVQSDDNVVSFQKSKGIYLLLLGIGVVVIIAVIIVIMMLKRKDTSSTKKIEDSKEKERA